MKDNGRKQRRAAFHPNPRRSKGTGPDGTSLARPAAQFTEEEKAAIIAAARFAYAQPKDNSLRAQVRAEMGRAAALRFLKESSRGQPEDN